MTIVKAKDLAYNCIFRVESEEGLFYRGQEYDLIVGLRVNTEAMIVLEPGQDVELVADIHEIAMEYIRQVESGARPAALFDYPRGMHYRSWKPDTDSRNGSVITIEGMEGYFSVSCHDLSHTEALRSDGGVPVHLTSVHKIDLLAYGVDLARDYILHADKRQISLASVIALQQEQAAAGMKNLDMIELDSLIRVPRERGVFAKSYRTHAYYGSRLDGARKIELEWDESVELIADIYDLARNYISEREASESQEEYFQPIYAPEDEETFPRMASSLPGETVARIAGRRGLFYIHRRDNRILAHRGQGVQPIAVSYRRFVEIVASTSDLAHWHIKRMGESENALPAKDHDQDQEGEGLRKFMDLPSGYVIRIPGEDGVFYTNSWFNVECTARRWDDRSIFHLDYDLPVEIVFGVYDLAKLCLQRMETASLPSRTMDSYPLYLEQPFIIRIAGKAGLYYTEIRKNESGLYVDRYDCYARRGDEEILLTQNMECEALLDMKDAAAQYIERFEEAAQYAQTRTEQQTPHLRTACGLSSGDVIRVPGETGLFYAVASYYGQFAYRRDESAIFALKGDQEVEIVATSVQTARDFLDITSPEDWKRERSTRKKHGSLVRIASRPDVYVIMDDLYGTPYALQIDTNERADLEWDQELEIIADGLNIAKSYIRRQEFAAD